LGAETIKNGLVYLWRFMHFGPMNGYILDFFLKHILFFNILVFLKRWLYKNDHDWLGDIIWILVYFLYHQFKRCSLQCFRKNIDRYSKNSLIHWYLLCKNDHYNQYWTVCIQVWFVESKFTKDIQASLHFNIQFLRSIRLQLNLWYKNDH